MIKKIVKKILKNISSDIYSRIETLEYRSFNRRFYAIEQCADYLVGAQIEGDYLEFGVYRGDTFSHSYKWISTHYPEMKFHAFDSFQGLPKPKGIDEQNGYTSNFHEKEFSCNEQEFLDSIERQGVDLKKVNTIKGWFNDSLNNEITKNINLNMIAIAWIDCDLYESTVPVLKFITPYLQVGSIIVFDDWRTFRNHPDYGEQRACKEWLEEHPEIKLSELLSFGWNGIAFTITEC